MATRLDVSKLSLMDALDLATLIEVEAHKRYKQFAERFGSSGADDAGAVFASMAENESKHGEEIAERRVALFGFSPPRVKIDDIFDVEAPYVGSPRWGMSVLSAYQVALASEEKAYAFYDQALRNIDQPEVKKLFEELREEEAEHVQMVKDIMAKLPPSASEELEDLDDYPEKVHSHKYGIDS
jgi:rubrerythrin